MVKNASIQICHSNQLYVGFSHIFQAAWLMRVVSCIDLTTLAGDDTKTNVTRLCYKAAKPIREDLLKLLKLNKHGTHFEYCVSLT